MSTETLAAFLNKVADDETLRKEFVQFAAAHGFELGALSDEDLENVAGGTSGGLTTYSTPTSDGAVPIPYPNVSTTPDSGDTTSKDLSADASSSSGDESGTLDGIVSGTNMSSSFPSSFKTNVRGL